jgi:HSP20 family protein
MLEERAMNITDLIPWRPKNRLPVRREENGERSFAPARRPFDRMFEDFFSAPSLWSRSPLSSFGEEWRGFSPSLDITETADEIRVTAELPGMEENDIDIALTGSALTIKGEKRAEHEEKGRNFHRIERSYGAFNRTIPLPQGAVDGDNVEATYKNGVLTIILPKLPEAQRSAKRITVK